MKKCMIVLTLVNFMICSLTAQTEVGKYTEWKNTIDELEVIKPYNFTQRKIVYILPVETSEVALPQKNNDNYPIVTKILKNLSEIIAEEMQNNLQKQGYTVKVADKIDFRDSEAIVIHLKWKELDLGSRALRAWVGFGAGNAKFSTDGVVFDGNDEVIRFSQKRLSVMDTRKYEDLAKKGVKAIAQDLAKMVAKL